MTNRTTVIINRCPFCGTEHEVLVDFDSYVNWLGGELIQVAMPYLTPTEREQLISGFCIDCQDMIFGDEDEE